MSTDQADAPQLVFICPQCSSPASATVRGTALWDGCDDEGDQLTYPVEWRFLHCERCRQPSIQSRQDYDYGHGFDDDEPVTVYPSPRSLSSQVPESLRREFEEARTCFSAKAYAATVVMVRRVLEGTCHESSVTEHPLARALEKLREGGLIDGTIAEWANALRVLGNEGAHFTGRPVPRDDAEDALAFAEALLQHIYVLRKRFNEFAERRAKKKPTAI
jgi:hypothetical protein